MSRDDRSEVWTVAPQTNKPGETKDVVVTLQRGLRLLSCFAPGRPEMTLSELVEAGGFSKTSTYRFLITLVEAGWLERTSTAAFRLTLKAFQVGSIAVDSLDVRREALPIMGALAAEAGDSVYLVVPDADRAVCLERVDGGDGPRLANLKVGGTQQLHLGAGPRALLAFREDELLPVLLSAGLEQATAASLTDLDALTANLAEIRLRGYATSRGDVTPGVGAVGGPVFDAHGQVVAALSLGGLLERMSVDREPMLASQVLAACRALSSRLGHTDHAA
jgi:DNA-binding IclR family transcriptional regulator